MKKLPLVEGLKKYLDENNIPFSMPGHKQGKGFNIVDFDINLNEIIIESDLTEVDGIDNLHKPEGIIKESLEALARYYDSKKSYFLVNGSTSGNLIMIFSALEEGDKILIERNCHKSIFNGIIMRKLNPIYLNNIISEKLNVPIAIDINKMKEIIYKEDIKAIILTYPNYYGIGCNIKEVIEFCKGKNIKVLVDSAHGAHFGVDSYLPKSAVKLGADMVVMSAHKTLPSLTQTAFLHVNNIDLIEKSDFYFSAFSSTSPSYMLMASMDYARAFLEYKGKEYYKILLNNLEFFKDKTKHIEDIKIVDNKFLKDEIEKYKICIDNTRLVINLKNEFNAHKFASYLRRNKIQIEMSDDNNVVFITTPFNTRSDFQKLIKVILNCNFNDFKTKNLKCKLYEIPKKVLLPYEVLLEDKEMIDFNKSNGRICAENIVPYPPGVPLLVLGERITNEHIEIINHLNEKGVSIIGLQDNNIKILKNKV